MGLFYEEFEIDRELLTQARTITEADIVAFAGLSGDYNLVHTDETFAAGTPFGTRIAHGPLGLSVA
ncbi:MAG: MaoC/PaaZ C-terminal domain-containing protein, partial [SAR324 cluster bacterium]|nr:MaoC/PaaZ C-terminal domain-containing protein [SAR324 cluster bacterium]